MTVEAGFEPSDKTDMETVKIKSFDADGNEIVDASGNPAVNAIIGGVAAGVGAGAPALDGATSSTIDYDTLGTDVLELSTIGAVAGDRISIYAPTAAYVEFSDSASVVCDTTSQQHPAGLIRTYIIPATATHVGMKAQANIGTAGITKE